MLTLWWMHAKHDILDIVTGACHTLDCVFVTGASKNGLVVIEVDAGQKGAMCHCQRHMPEMGMIDAYKE